MNPKEEDINGLFDLFNDDLNNATNEYNKLKIYKSYIAKIGSKLFNDDLTFTGVKIKYMMYIAKKAIEDNKKCGVYGILFSKYNNFKGLTCFSHQQMLVACKRLKDNGEVKIDVISQNKFYELTESANLDYSSLQLKLFSYFNQYIYFINNSTLVSEVINDDLGTYDISQDISFKQKEDEIIHPNLKFERESREKIQQFEKEKNSLPKCPTCGSTSIEKISSLNRAVSVGLFGLVSSKIGKTMECNSCGYKW